MTQNITPEDFIGFVGARKNSKGLPGKNKLKINNMPIFLIALDKLRSAGLKKIIFSSDCDEMLEVAAQNKYIAEKRPKEFASDTTRIPEEILRLYKKNQWQEKFVVSVPPTSPLLEVRSIRSAIGKISETPGVESCISVTDWKGSYPGLAFFNHDDGSLRNVGTELNISTYPRQERIIFKQNSGSFYIRNLAKMKSGHANITNNWLGDAVIYQNIKDHEAINIDTASDWKQILEYLGK